MIYLVSLVVFTSMILVLVGMLMLVEAKLVPKGGRTIEINGDPEKSVQSKAGTTLLSALSSKSIFLPSACGGGGSCGMCRCKVEAGGGDILPTELAHLSRTEKKENIRLACQVKIRDDMKIRIPEEIFSIKKYGAKVVSNDNVATFIKELAVELKDGEILDFKAGQYIQIDIPEYEMSFSELKLRVAERFRSAWDQFQLWGLKSKVDEPIFRAYSLASPPSEADVLRFTIRIATPPPGVAGAPPGQGSSFVFNLKQGDEIFLSGPYGDFLVKETDREMCFLGGGAGMAPLRSQIRDELLRKNTKRRMSFWYGARSLQEMFYDEEFKELAENYDNFSYHVALSDPQKEDNWTGLTGFIHQAAYDHYLKDHEDPAEIEYYLCGPPMMIDAVINMLDNLGVEPEMIAYDKF